MTARKGEFRFHGPDSPAAAAVLLQILVEARCGWVEQALADRSGPPDAGQKAEAT